MITKINSLSPSFGVVKRSAAEKAIINANNDAAELQNICNFVKSQKNNDKYDVEASLYYNYMTIKRGENSGQGFKTLKEACLYATAAKEYDKYKESLEDNPYSKGADNIIKEILKNCD